MCLLTWKRGALGGWLLLVAQVGLAQVDQQPSESQRALEERFALVGVIAGGGDDIVVLRDHEKDRVHTLLVGDVIPGEPAIQIVRAATGEVVLARDGLEIVIFGEGRTVSGDSGYRASFLDNSQGYGGHSIRSSTPLSDSAMGNTTTTLRRSYGDQAEVEEVAEGFEDGEGGDWDEGEWVEEGADDVWYDEDDAGYYGDETYDDVVDDEPRFDDEAAEGYGENSAATEFDDGTFDTAD